MGVAKPPVWLSVSGATGGTLGVGGGGVLVDMDESVLWPRGSCFLPSMCALACVSRHFTLGSLTVHVQTPGRAKVALCLVHVACFVRPCVHACFLLTLRSLHVSRPAN